MLEKVKLIGPRINLNRLTESISVEIADRIGNSWDEWFGLLKRFKAREGHLRVLARHREGTLNFGYWVNQQRINRERMPPERRQRLDAIGFIWDLYADLWEEAFAALKKFKAREGHCRVPPRFLEGTSNLGGWVQEQRAKQSSMSAERRGRLDAIGFVWDPFARDWEEGVAALTNFKAREGHCRVPYTHIEGPVTLGRWVTKQRGKRNAMPAERRQRLNAIGFVWDSRESWWEEGFAALEKFKGREGHCLVPAGQVEGTVRLGQWVSHQRQIRDKMPPQRRRRLDEIGFVWDLIQSFWEEGFAALNKFKTREGHCRVPQGFVEGTFKLWDWVRTQRANRSKLSTERRKRLHAVGFVWDPFDAAWEKGFAALNKFKTREGHCRVPQSFVEGTFRLGQWVSVQRGDRYTLPPERLRRLNSIGFDWDPKETAWEKAYKALENFKSREGHCRVPDNFVKGTIRLGRWVSHQRAIRDAMPAEHRRRLTDLGLVWDVLEDTWESGFAALKKFKAREGHCRVPVSHVEGTYQLGSWVHVQRVSRGTMPAEHRQRLNATGFVWDPLADDWEEGFAALRSFKEREGHCRTPRNHVEGTFRLGQWVVTQRTRRDKMLLERTQRLDAIGFVWDPLEGAWEEGFAALTTFKAHEGHCRVPAKHAEGVFKLGQWVQRQRTGTMTPQRRQRLDAIGFVWDPFADDWEEGFAALTKFKTRKGHCRVSYLYNEGTFKLGLWVARQRGRKTLCLLNTGNG